MSSKLKYLVAGLGILAVLLVFALIATTLKAENEMIVTLDGYKFAANLPRDEHWTVNNEIKHDYTGDWHADYTTYAFKNDKGDSIAIAIYQIPESLREQSDEAILILKEEYVNTDSASHYYPYGKFANHDARQFNNGMLSSIDFRLNNSLVATISGIKPGMNDPLGLIKNIKVSG